MIFSFELANDLDSANVGFNKGLLDSLRQDTPERVEQFKAEIINRVAFAIDHAITSATPQKEGTAA